MENVEGSEGNAFNGWPSLYGRELNSEEVMEIETNIQKLAEVIIEIEKGKRVDG